MEGIQFLVDEAGEPTSVLIDLAVWGETWEDFYDALVAHSQLGEETVSWEEVKAEIRAERTRETATHTQVSGSA